MDKCKHCTDGCIHLISREVPGTLHDNGFMRWRDPSHTIIECELYPEKYHSWMEEFGQVPRNMLTEKEYSCFNECYEANEFQKTLDDILGVAQRFLDLEIKLKSSGD